MDRVFSGIQPSGVIHIGNYIGAIKNWVKIQYEYPSIFCIVDYHAITVEYDPSKMPETILNAVIVNLSCGLDPKVSKIFLQSSVKEHTELTWILNTVTPFGELTRMTQFKDKAKQQHENVNLGLFSYPVLMTADIILYKANLIPVGEDQLQHLEFAREIVRKFNSRYKEIFPEPKPYLSETPRILGLDGESKMSKSMNNYISLDETEESLWNKLKGAKTDENRKRRSDPGDPNKCNIYTLHKNFSSQEEILMIDKECRCAGIGCVDCKKILSKNLFQFMSPIKDKMEYYRNHISEVRDILQDGSEYCRKTACQTMDEVKMAMGLKVY